MVNVIIGLIIGIFSAVLIYYIIVKRNHERETQSLINEVDFLACLLKRDFPDGEILDDLPCRIIDTYRGVLSDIFYQKFLTEKIDFVVLENFLQEMTEYIACRGKENLLKDIIKEAIANVDNNKLISDLADFIEEQDDEPDMTFVLFSQAIYERKSSKDTAIFFNIFNKKMEEILEGKSDKKKSYIKRMWWVIK